MACRGAASGADLLPVVVGRWCHLIRVSAGRGGGPDVGLIRWCHPGARGRPYHAPGAGADPGRGPGGG